MLARQATWLEPALQLKVFKAYLARTPVVCSGSSMCVVPATSKAGQTIKYKLQFEHTEQLQTLQAQCMRSCTFMLTLFQSWSSASILQLVFRLLVPLGFILIKEILCFAQHLHDQQHLRHHRSINTAKQQHCLEHCSAHHCKQFLSLILRHVIISHQSDRFGLQHQKDDKRCK